MGYLLALNPLRDRAEQDEFVDIPFEETDEPSAVKRATDLAQAFGLEYWELFQVVQVRGCHLSQPL